MPRLVPAILFLLTAGAFGAKEASAPVGPDAVWQQANQFLPELHRACDQYSGAKLGECFAEQMAKHASPTAAAFTRSIHNDGFMRDFRKTVEVDIAYVEYPFRANKEACLLVNGSPAFVDVDDPKKLPKEELKRGATLLPGERSSNLYPLAILYPDGAEEFVVDYKVEGQTAFFGFQFNSKGKFNYARLLGTQNPSLEQRSWPVQVRTGQQFTVLLDSPSDWSMAQAGAEWIVRQIGNEKSWTFETVGAGTTKMTLRHGADELTLKLVVAPGLRK